MKPTKEQLEALAEKHIKTVGGASSITGEIFVIYGFTLDQLDAYFNERLKMIAGRPVAYEHPNPKYPEDRFSTYQFNGYKPLYALEIKE